MGKISEKIKEVSLSWIKKFGSILLTIFAGVVAIFTFGRINDLVKRHDSKKKDELKDNIDIAKTTSEELKEELEESVEKTEEIKNIIEEKQKEARNDEKDYVSKQEERATKAGFVKKQKN